MTAQSPYPKQIHRPRYSPLWLLPCRLLPKKVPFNQFYKETPVSHSPTPHVLPKNKKGCRQTAINAPTGGPLFRCFRASQDLFASPLPGHPCTSYRSCVTMHTKNSPYLLRRGRGRVCNLILVLSTPLTRVVTPEFVAIKAAPIS